MLFSIAENAQRTFSVYAGLGRVVENALKPLRAQQGLFKHLAESVGRFADQHHEIDEHLDAFVLRHGWPIPLDLPMSAYARIVKMSDRPKREVSAAMNHWFRPESRPFRSCAHTLLERPLLASRRPLVKQALRAHRRGEHYLVINSLLPLVEGVLVDGVFRDDSLPQDGRVQRAVTKLKTGDPDDSVLRAVESLVVAGAAGMGLFTKSDPTGYGRPGEPRSLNRHAILHGYARRYATRANALRMILLMAVLVEVIDLYHLPPSPQSPL